MYEGRDSELESRSKGMTTVSVKSLLDRILGLAYFQGKSPAIPYHMIRTSSRLVLVLGENTGGKSFVRRLVQSCCGKAGVECMSLSMEGRSGSGVAWKSFIYGMEDLNSTGDCSVYTCLTTFKTCKSRETPHVVFWDEPDIGLSESWSAGLGQEISRFIQNLPDHTKAVFLSTHSRPLVQQLVALKPNFLHVGVPASEAPQTLQDWLQRPVVPQNIRRLGPLGRKRFEAIQKILNR